MINHLTKKNLKHKLSNLKTVPKRTNILIEINKLNNNYSTYFNCLKINLINIFIF